MDDMVGGYETHGDIAMTQEPKNNRTESHEQTHNFLFVDILNNRRQTAEPGMNQWFPAECTRFHVDNATS